MANRLRWSSWASSGRPLRPRGKTLQESCHVSDMNFRQISKVLIDAWCRSSLVRQKLPVPTPEMRRGQHARMRRRNQMPDAQHLTDQPRTFRHRWRQQRAQPGTGLVLFTDSRITDINREREKHALLLRGRAEIAVGNYVQRLVATIIGMRAPSKIGQESCGMTQSPVLLGFPDLRRPDEAVGPIDQIVGMARRAWTQIIQMPCSRE